VNRALHARRGRTTFLFPLPLVVALCLGLPGETRGQAAGVAGWAQDPPVLGELVDFARQQSDLRVALERYREDHAALLRRYEVELSPARQDRLRSFYQAWQQRLGTVDFDGLNREGQVDYLLLRNRIARDLAQLEEGERRWREMEPLLPFAEPLRLLQERRHDRVREDARGAADTLDRLAGEVERLTAGLAAGTGAPAGSGEANVTAAVGLRAAAYVEHLRSVVADWSRFYDGYDPVFTWWVRVPNQRLDAALEAYAGGLRHHLAGIRPGEPEPLIGDPVLASGLVADLTVEMIPYTPEQLIAIGWRELEWTEQRFREVSRRMGFGDDWKAALEHVKTLAPPPGEKPWAIFDIAEYSEAFVDRLGNITVPPLSAEVWRLAMQTAERQLINPFFTGGEVTRVSYPTDAMSHADKLMSMRGNTPHFNFATVHHELIPGHHLQGFMTSRFNAHRGGPFSTPFWGEGWALYWELLLWDEDFPRNDADRIGMLFWRMHRAARIIFSLSFHLEQMTAQEAVDFLVERVGHERANAEAEVRRSILAVPLYQAAYLLGGLQFRELHRELVDSGRMTSRQFHDAVLQGGRIPVELVRARLSDQPLSRDYTSSWRFYGEVR
jgi:hypothetical protein